MQRWAVRLRYNALPDTTVFNHTPIWGPRGPVRSASADAIRAPLH
jgi:hypothetical protein